LCYSDEERRCIVPGKIMTLEQVAEMLDVSERTVMREIEAGKLKAFRVGRSWRVRSEALDEYIRSQESPTEQDSGTSDEDPAA
jgi:excisionase family DNA binding protein